MIIVIVIIIIVVVVNVIALVLQSYRWVDPSMAVVVVR